MQSSSVRSGVAVAVLLVVAAVVFVPLIGVQKVQSGRLARLVVTTPPAGFNPKPTAKNTVPFSNSQLAAVKVAGKRSPHSTGGYSIEWSDSSSGSNAVSLSVTVLPSAADAAKVQAEAVSAYASKSSLKADSYTYANAVPVPSIPGATGSFYTPATLTNPPLVVVAFRAGRSQAIEFIGIPGEKQAIENEAVSFADTEYRHLLKVLPGFSLSETTFPFVASLVYWIVVAAVALAVVVGPVSRRRVLARRAALAERARVQHKTGRGSKIAKRQAARRR